MHINSEIAQLELSDLFSLRENLPEFVNKLSGEGGCPLRRLAK
jgi:hypothetical protein